MKNGFRVLASLVVSAGIRALLFREAEKPAREVAQALGSMGLGVWAAYALAQVVQDDITKSLIAQNEEKYALLRDGAVDVDAAQRALAESGAAATYVIDRLR